MKIFLLSGYACSGKDQCARLMEAYDYKAFAFAYELKKEVSEIYNINLQSMFTQEGKRFLYDSQKTVRNILIEHGQNRRKENVNYWSDKVIKEIYDSEHNKIVITDWRFISEYNAIIREFYRENVYTVRIDRFFSSSIDNKSETSLDRFPFDFAISNKSDIDTFNQNIKNILPM